ncbi:SUKH-4 family immunity protein [Streptomyces sp. TLI_171]|uniref:SUKH-4 family immunity protein n=1 Tax=Streptomyces sp. TLI_171 TaxID=1938859 RepID=UPI000C1A8973|nr:SUKH-4 family immunity protein [Streptomyces sp. TLI_171]RKE20224.1 SUKH-4 immunity protein of toxin-antitoxin system [Streptomyces sp. TLI_171]
MVPVDSPLPVIQPVTRAELEVAYGVDGLFRVSESQLPAVVTDPGTRAFLSEIGLPHAPGAFIRPERPPLPPLSERSADPAGCWPELPNNGSTMVVLGSWGTVFALDGATGEVYALLPHQEATVDGRPTHRSQHSLLRCQLAFGAQELNLLGDLMEYGLPIDDGIEPDLTRHPGWDSILRHFRYGY